MRENFGDQVELWQVYNEADHAHYQLFKPASRDAEYLGEFAEMLGTAQRVFGSGDGGRPITTGWPMNDEREQEWYLVLDATAAQVDVLGFSVYPADNSDEIARLAGRMQRVQERYGKPIFVAETGLQTGRAHGSKRIRNGTYPRPSSSCEVSGCGASASTSCGTPNRRGRRG